MSKFSLIHFYVSKFFSFISKDFTHIKVNQESRRNIEPLGLKYLILYPQDRSFLEGVTVL